MKMNKMVILMGISALVAGMASDCLAAKKKTTTKAKPKTTAKSKEQKPSKTTAKAKPGTAAQKKAAISNKTTVLTTPPPAPVTAPPITITTATINTQDQHGNIPLNIAIATSKGDVTKITTLLNMKANVNAMDKVGFTPLMTAASRGYTDIVNLLISKGANTKLTRNNKPNGQTALSLTPKKYPAIRTLLSK